MMSTEQSNPSEKVENRHSSFGIASLSSGLLALLCLVLGLVPTSSSKWFGMLFYATCLLIPAGIVLGVIGLFQKNRKKILAIIGLALSVVTVVGLGLIILFGGQ